MLGLHLRFLFGDAFLEHGNALVKRVDLSDRRIDLSVDLLLDRHLPLLFVLNTVDLRLNRVVLLLKLFVPVIQLVKHVLKLIRLLVPAVGINQLAVVLLAVVGAHQNRNRWRDQHSGH